MATTHEQSPMMSDQVGLAPALNSSDAQTGVFFEPHFEGETLEDRSGLSREELESSNNRVRRVWGILSLGQ